MWNLQEKEGCSAGDIDVSLCIGGQYVWRIVPCGTCLQRECQDFGQPALQALGFSKQLELLSCWKAALCGIQSGSLLIIRTSAESSPFWASVYSYNTGGYSGSHLSNGN
jgi:hypothetical protein